ncbi:hypothetical protein BKA62DRAFT_699211 [Auriculariales sp. MPI-PUGE-AT-0066]|nr:hypothetical protein BKA62DRAFT_699211 [Auriculariales sp. MPI-PUGE-AT-0066]
MSALPIPLHATSDDMGDTSMRLNGLSRSTSRLDVIFDDSESIPLPLSERYTPGNFPNLRYLGFRKYLSPHPLLESLVESATNPGHWNSISEIQMKGVFSGDEYTYGLFKVLLQRTASSLSGLHLLPHGFHYLSKNVNWDDIIPELSKLRTLTVSGIPLRLLTAILKKSVKLKSLVIEGRPHAVGDYGTAEPDEPDWDETNGRTPSLKTIGTNRFNIRPSNLARALLDVRVFNSASGMHIKSFSIIPFGVPDSPRQTRLIAAGARIVLGLPAMSGITHFTIDRSLFTTFVARKVDLPKRLVVLRVFFTEFDCEDGPEPDIWGEKYATPELVLGHFSKQLKDGAYKNLRAVKLFNWTTQGPGSGRLAINLTSIQWRTFRDVCASRRISLNIIPVTRFGKLFEVSDQD